MAKGAKGKGGGAGGRDQPRDRDGKFAPTGGGSGSHLMATARRVGGITGKTAGGAALGGYRGIRARARLAHAKRQLEQWRSEARDLRAEQGPERLGGTVKTGAKHAENRRSLLKRIARHRRAVKTHEREVARVEKRGLQRVKSDEHVRFRKAVEIPNSGGKWRSTLRSDLGRKLAKQPRAERFKRPEPLQERRADRVVRAENRLSATVAALRSESDPYRRRELYKSMTTQRRALSNREREYERSARGAGLMATARRLGSTD